jgi:predicted cobalt transporter CbtA
MNFLSDNTWVSIIGIVCLLVPMIIGKFLPDDGEENLAKERV